MQTDAGARSEGDSDEEIRSTSISYIHDLPLPVSDQPYKSIGIIILLVTFGLFGGWAAFAPLDSAALAPGVVTVKNYRKNVQHLEGGIVKDILVREGDTVRESEALIMLDDTQFRAEQEVLRGQLFSMIALEARLLSERDGHDKVNYPEILRTHKDSRVDDAIAGQNQVFMARRNANEGEREVLEQRVQQLQLQIDGVEAVYDSNLELLRSYEKEISDLRGLLGQGYTDKQRLTGLERERAKLVGANAEALAGIAAFRIKVGETRLQVLQLEKYQRTEIVGELGDVQPKVFDVEERLHAIKDKVDRSIIRSPVDGVILGMNVHTIGGIVRPATRLLEIVPEEQQLMVDAEVSPRDIDRVRKGMLAKIRFSAFRTATTPIVEGTVINLSADRLIHEENGVPYYLAQIEVSLDSLKKLRGLKLMPGMPAEVLISTGNRTLLQYILQPASNAFARSMIED